MLLKDSLQVPDLNPVKIDMYYHDNQENKFYGILVSPYIGVKVFLNSISAQFGFAPTKVRIYKAF